MPVEGSSISFRAWPRGYPGTAALVLAARSPNAFRSTFGEVTRLSSWIGGFDPHTELQFLRDSAAGSAPGSYPGGRRFETASRIQNKQSALCLGPWPFALCETALKDWEWPEPVPGKAKPSEGWQSGNAAVC